MSHSITSLMPPSLLVLSESGEKKYCGKVRKKGASLSFHQHIETKSGFLRETAFYEEKIDVNAFFW